jgi:hypothetical protein
VVLDFLLLFSWCFKSAKKFVDEVFLCHGLFSFLSDFSFSFFFYISGANQTRGDALVYFC